MKEKKFIRCGTHLPVKVLRVTLDCYRDALGFSGEWTEGNKDGGICRDELRMLFAENEYFTNAINTKHHRLPLLRFVDNIEVVFDEFKKHKVALADELRKRSYGMKEFALLISMGITSAWQRRDNYSKHHLLFLFRNRLDR